MKIFITVVIGTFLTSAYGVNFAKNEEYTKTHSQDEPREEQVNRTPSSAELKDQAGYNHYGTTTEYGQVEDASRKLKASQYRGSKSVISE